MTETKEQVWFHCGNCGSLFESGFEHDETRVCTACGKNPGTGVWPLVDILESDPEPNRSNFQKQPEALIEDSDRRAVRKKRSANLMMKGVVVWTFLMLLAVWLHTRNLKSADEKDKIEQVASRMTKGTLADENIALLNKALPDCHRALRGFLTAGTPEGRNQSVINPIETAGKMATFYSYNPLPRVDVKDLQRIGQEIIRVGDTRMVFTRWKEKNGVEFDALFRRNAGSWRLDWNHFSQYSEYPWTLFLAGEGPDEAEFRLLARQRLSDSNSEQIDSRLIFTMFTPAFGNSGDNGMESPDFVIDRQSDEGLLIGAAFAAQAAGKEPFGQKMEALQERGLVRLHVRVKRSIFGGNRTFRLEKIIACHWIDSKEVGYDLEELKDDIFGN